jgi:predicted GNAT family N-acyltransferase
VRIDVEQVDGRVTRELRRRVLRPEWPIGTPMHGDDIPEALHLAAFDPDGIGLTLLGACVLLPAPYPLAPNLGDAWQLRGMVTDPEFRGRGVGAAVLDCAVRNVAARRGRLLWCQARITAVDFYARHGFVAEGEHFLHAETGIEHVHMRREPIVAPSTSTQ